MDNKFEILGHNHWTSDNICAAHSYSRIIVDGSTLSHVMFTRVKRGIINEEVVSSFENIPEWLRKDIQSAHLTALNTNAFKLELDAFISSNNIPDTPEASIGFRFDFVSGGDIIGDAANSAYEFLGFKPLDAECQSKFSHYVKTMTTAKV